MRAWRLSLADERFDYRELPDPEPRVAGVTVRMAAAPLLSYLRAFVAGELPGYLPPGGEFTPGTNGVGVIERVGDQVYGLAPGQRVFLSPHVAAAENVPAPAEALIGLTALGPDAVALMEAWPDGTLAELASAPAATVTPVPAALSGMPDERLAAISRCMVPYGGLLRARLSAGETVVVHGATGAFGTGAVLVGLAMGAARVVAAGRNETALARLGELARVVPVRLTGDVDADGAALREAAGGGAECALDMVGQADSSNGTLATLHALGRGGRLVLMGGLAAPLPLDPGLMLRTGWEVMGNFMYPRTAPGRLLTLLAAGRLDIDPIPVATRPLHDLEKAMREAERPGAPLVVMTPPVGDSV